MLLKDSVIQTLLECSRRPRGTPLGGPDDLPLILEQERARADRGGGAFSLLQLRAAGSNSDRRAMVDLTEYALTRMRLSDRIGWGAGCEVWLVMPNCSAAAADNLGRDLTAKFVKRAGIAYDVFHYEGNDSGPNGHRRTDAAPSVRRELFPQDVTANAADSSARTRPIKPLFVQPNPLWKRLLDIVLATLALVLLSPLFVLVALAVKFTSRGPMLYSQWRAGRSGKPFKIYKFRSMVVDADAQKRALRGFNEQDGPAFKIEKDPRVTRVGRFLRAASIDELPQLWNVLRGEMSFVGPRPLPVDEAAACESWQQERLDVTPGLTCLWQVKDRRTKIAFADWMRLDIRYVRARSPMLDLILIAQTCAFVLQRKGT